jgi:hypothetical protein
MVRKYKPIELFDVINVSLLASLMLIILIPFILLLLRLLAILMR